MDSAKACWLLITMEEEAIQLGAVQACHPGLSTWVDSHPFCTVGTLSYGMCEQVKANQQWMKCATQVEGPGDMESYKARPTRVLCGLVLEESAV